MIKSGVGTICISVSPLQILDGLVPRDIRPWMLPHFTVYETACDLEKSFSFENTVEYTFPVRFPIHV